MNVRGRGPDREPERVASVAPDERRGPWEKECTPEALEVVKVECVVGGGAEAEACSATGGCQRSVKK